MKRNRWIHLSLVAAAAALAACSDTTTPAATVVTDAQLNADVAQTSGDAIASDVGEMVASEAFAGMPAPPAFDVLSPPGVTVNRSRTCYGGGVVQAACNATTTDSVVITMTMDGSFSNTNTTPHGTESMNVTLHRARQLTISGLAGTESSRNHNGVGSGSDTTVFSGTTDGASRTRTLTTAGTDSVQSVVFNLPHASNPWPVSGKIVRNVSGKVVVTGGPNPGERTFTRRIEVDFPADAQGNVTIHINDKTCNANLVTRVVSGCTT